MQNKILSVITVLLLSALLFGSVFAAKPLTYTPNDVGTFGDGTAEFSDINDQGFVVGNWRTNENPGIPHAFVWSLADGKTDLAELPGQTYSEVAGINNRGQITGYCGLTTTPPSNSPVIWTSPTTIMQLDPTVKGQTRDINDKGQIVGFTEDPQYLEIDGKTQLYQIQQEAFIWSAKDGITYLNIKEEGVKVPCIALGISNNGIVVGCTLWEDENGLRHENRAFKWTANTGTVFLPTPEHTTMSLARDVNNKGEVVGQYIKNEIQYAVLWTKNGEMLELGTLEDYEHSVAVGINNKGQVVGFSKDGPNYKTPSVITAFIWTAKAGLTALPDPEGGSYSKALAINNAGQIVGTSKVSEAVHAVFWSPSK